jgi:MurNAc alpha-1-phosphate uridylyltransferase
MILAAGRGTRLGILGETVPKALVEVKGKPLIAYHLERLAHAEISEVVINIAHLGNQIRDRLGDGRDFGLHIQYSVEPENAYETGGGILHALPLLGHDPFIVMNADIWTDFSPQEFPAQLQGNAHIILVDNPPAHPQGDYHLRPDGRVAPKNNFPTLTFSGMGLYHPKLFTHCQAGRFRLPTLFDKAMETNDLSGQHFKGEWMDVGTIERLAFLNKL